MESVALFTFIFFVVAVIFGLVWWDRKQVKRGQKIADDHWKTMLEMRNRNHNQSLPPGKVNPPDGGRKEKP